MPARPVPVNITANSEAAVTPDMLEVKPLGRARLASTSPVDVTRESIVKEQAAALAPPPAEKPKPELAPAMKMLASLETTLAAWRAILGNDKTPEHARKLYEERVLYLFTAKQELDPPPPTTQQPADTNGGGA